MDPIIDILALHYLSGCRPSSTGADRKDLGVVTANTMLTGFCTDK